MVELVNEFDEKSYHEMFEKVSRLLKYDSIFFGPQTYIYGHQHDHFTPLVLRVRGKNAISSPIRVGIEEECGVRV